MGAYFPCAVAITSSFFTPAGVPPLALLSLSIFPFNTPNLLLNARSIPKHTFQAIYFPFAAASQPVVSFTALLLILQIFFLISFDYFQVPTPHVQQSAGGCQRTVCAIQ